MPDAAGIDSVVSIQYVDDKVPVIVLTGFEDEQLATRAMQIGAQDYLPKGDIEEKLLERAIRYAIQRKRLVERSKAHLQTEQLVASIFVSAHWIGRNWSGDSLE